MPLTKVGSFAVPSSTGNLAVTPAGGLGGATPKAIIFFGNRVTADGAAGSGSPLPALAGFYGMAVSSSSRMVMNLDDSIADLVTSSDATKCIKHITGGAVSFAADFVSMDPDGFTVNFTTANATAYLVNYKILYGTDLTNAAIKAFTAPTSTGNDAQTGVGFKPDAMIAMIADTFGGAHGGVSIGFGVSSTQRGGSSTNYDGSSGSRYQLNDKFIVVNKGLSVLRQADIVSLDADGFTLNWINAAANPPTVYVLCLKGGNYFVGSFTQKTSSGSQALTGVGFAPSGLLTSSIGSTHNTSPVTSPGGLLMFSAASGVSNQTVFFYLSGSNGVYDLDRSAFQANYNDSPTPTVVAKAAITSLDSDGFTQNWSTADATAREMILMVFGQPAGSTPSVPLGARSHGRPAMFKPMGDAFRPGKFGGFR